jgi:Mrp family chromosome partitioning ATPase
MQLDERDRSVETEGRDLRQLLEPIRRRWLMVALIALAVAAATYYHYRSPTAEYKATTNVYVQPSPLDTQLGAGAGGGDPSRTLENQARLVQTPTVATVVARRLHIKGNPRDLLDTISVTPATDSDFMTISATSTDPQQAADLANAFAMAFVDVGTGQLRAEAAATRTKLQAQIATLGTSRANRALVRTLQARVREVALIEALPTQAARQVDRATPPAKGSAPSQVRNTFFALILGLLLGALLALGLDALDRRVRSSRVEAEYGLPLLGSLPHDRRAALDMQRPSALPPAMVEPIRKIRTALDHGATGEAAPQTILVTSAVGGEGKSTLTKSLALAFLESGRDVLVIDADLRNPRLHDFFGVTTGPGLSEVLRGETTLELSVQEAPLGDIRPAVLPVGEPSTKPSLLLAEPGGARSRLRGLGNGDGGRHGSVLPERLGGQGTDPEAVLHVLTAGRAVGDPASLLGGEPMVNVLMKVASRYNVVLIDSAPLLPVSDTVPLLGVVDGVVAVTRSDHTTRDDAQRFRRELKRLPHVRVLGLVATGARDAELPTPYHFAGAA